MKPHVGPGGFRVSRPGSSPRNAPPQPPVLEHTGKPGPALGGASVVWWGQGSQALDARPNLGSPRWWSSPAAPLEARRSFGKYPLPKPLSGDRRAVRMRISLGHGLSLTAATSGSPFLGQALCTHLPSEPPSPTSAPAAATSLVTPTQQACHLPEPIPETAPCFFLLASTGFLLGTWHTSNYFHLIHSKSHCFQLEGR